MKIEKFKLTGDRDYDKFLEEKDMSSTHWSILMGCHHQGQCNDDTREALKYFEVEDILKVSEYLEEFIEDVEGKDDDELLQSYLWVLSADIQELAYDEEE